MASRIENGRERKTLVLYDTMPGGTGYLQRFYTYLPQIAQRVRTHLRGETCETACYSCLKESWNQRVHALLDRLTLLQEQEEKRKEVLLIQGS